MSYRISIRARRCLAAIGVAASVVIGLAGSAYAEARTPRLKGTQLKTAKFKTAENVSPRPHDRVYLTYNPYSYLVAVEGGVSSGTTAAGIGNLERETIGFKKTFMGADVALRLPFVTLPADAAVSVIAGMKIRSYFGGEHRDDQNLIHYKRDWMFMPYVGMPFAVPQQGQPLGGQQFIITPFVGPIFEQGNLQIFDGQGNASVTRTGLGVGINFDLVLPSTNGFRPFIGVGGQLSFMQSVSKTIDNFDVHLDSNVETRAVIRGGVHFP